MYELDPQKLGGVFESRQHDVIERETPTVEMTFVL
jgi:hypothetical protein